MINTEVDKNSEWTKYAKSGSGYVFPKDWKIEILPYVAAVENYDFIADHALPEDIKCTFMYICPLCNRKHTRRYYNQSLKSKTGGLCFSWEGYECVLDASNNEQKRNLIFPHLDKIAEEYNEN